MDSDGFAVPLLPPSVKLVSVESSNDAQSTSNEPTAENVHTVFISNLDFKLPKEKVEEVFPSAKEVRLVYRGMSKLHKVNSEFFSFS